MVYVVQGMIFFPLAMELLKCVPGDEFLVLVLGYDFLALEMELFKCVHGYVLYMLNGVCADCNE